MVQSDLSDRPSNSRSASGIVKAQQQLQLFACDRCRGQKLRCIRTQNLHTSCERCQKAGATCIIDSSVRMGRPQRTDKERRETNSSRKFQPTHSPNSPTLRRTSSQTASKNFTTNGNILLWHDPEETIDSNLVGVQYQEFLDFGLALEDDQSHKSPSDDSFDNTFNFAPSQEPRILSDSGMYEFGTEETIGSLQPSPFISNEPVAISNIAAEKPNVEGFPEVKIQNDSPPMPRESVEKVSNLNLELRRQLRIVGRMAKECADTEPSLVESPDKNNSLSCAIVFMVQGLQTFHELLLEILGSANQNSCKETSHTAMYNSQNNHPPLQHTFWRNTKPCPTSLLSLTDTRDTDLVESISKPKNKQQKVSRSDTSSKSHHIPDGLPQITLLDMSTSLLIISCYINLIHLCRDVFAAIRGALPAPGHQTTLLTLPGFQISGVSIHEDSDLQIKVLTQVVVRLVDRIGHSLGHPYNSTAEAGKKDEAKLCGKAILPQLLDFVLRQGGIGEQPSCKGGIEALREEIRRLNEAGWFSII